MNRRTIIWMIPAFLWAGIASGQEPADGAPSAPRSRPAGRMITLNMQKGEITDALRLVAEQGGLNLVIGPEVKGEVSVYLTNASLETALRAIAVNNGFAFSLEDDVISVSKPAEKAINGPPPMPPRVSRVFQLRSVDAERVKSAIEPALTRTPDGKAYGQITVLNQNSDQNYGVQRLSSLGGDATGTSTGGTDTSFSGNASVGRLIGGGNAFNGGIGGIGGIGGATTGADGLTPPRNARTLIVTDTEESIARIAELIEDLDRLPPQVLIEARIVEMTTDLQRQLGIEWDVNVLANGPVLDYKWPLKNEFGFASGSQVPRNASGTAQTSAGLALGSIDFSRFTALLQANQDDNAIRLLANPRLLVYNNHSASILVGERYPILQASVSNFGTVTEAFQTYIPVGVQLEVTPTIMMDGKLNLLVHPATSALGDDVVGTTGLRVARIRTRELDTRVIMNDGQTIVLGGLISDRKAHSASKIPGLGDVPILDIFFRQENPRSDRVDLLIFLTAHVEGADKISERDQQVYDMYRPQFKEIQRLQDVPLHFEIPTEYQPPKPMFSEPPPESNGDAEPVQAMKAIPANASPAAQAGPPAPKPDAKAQADAKEKLDEVP